MLQRHCLSKQVLLIAMAMSIFLTNYEASGQVLGVRHAAVKAADWRQLRRYLGSKIATAICPAADK